jgi:DNA-binding response OmpR family regulator
VQPYKYDPNRTVLNNETHILLAEDGEIYARILHSVMSKAGYTLSWVDDGAKAYEIIRDGFRPSLLLTDVMMPGMSGFELLTRLQAENILPPTIVLTGLQKEEEVLRGLQSGALDYIKKPFSPTVLLARVQLVLSRHVPPNSQSG